MKITLRELKQGCPFLYEPNGELFMMDDDACTIQLTGKGQGNFDFWPGLDVIVYPVTVTMTYKI